MFSRKNKSNLLRRVSAGLAVAVSLLAVPVAVAMTTSQVAAAPALPAAQMQNFADVTDPKCKDKDCLIDKYVNPAIKILSAMVGIAVVIAIIVGGIQYSSAGGDPGKVAAAKSQIAKAIGALVMYIFLYAFLNFIIPGGVN